MKMTARVNLGYLMKKILIGTFLPLYLPAMLFLLLQTTDSASDTLIVTPDTVQAKSGVADKPTHVELLVIKGPIGPVTLRVITKAIEESEKSNAQALIIQLDTPGGLTESTWEINGEILASNVPVVMYIAPPGARAGSAGVYITYACHISAMAPQTNIGSAHPVGIAGQQPDSILSDKITNDAVAKIKTLATKRGRNIEWAEKAVRESSSITEYEALELGVIEYISDDIPGLLAQIDGDTVEVISGEVILETKNSRVNEIDIGFGNRILEVLSNPNIAYILLTIGMMGLYFEFSNPGAIVPGVVGGICLILAFFAFQTLPINYAGLALMILAIILFILELKVTSHGILAIGGTISLFLGSIMLIDSDLPYMKISLTLIIPVVIATAGFFLFAIYFALKAHRRKVTTGESGLVGEVAVIREMKNGEGVVFVHGEYWKALGTEDFSKGTKVKIIDVDGMHVKVDRI
jgi:membrane-bound serine protease (ClpP class)